MTKTNYLEYPETQVKFDRSRSSTPAELSSEDLESSDIETDESESEIPEPVPMRVIRVTWRSSSARCTEPTQSFQSQNDLVCRRFEGPITRKDEPMTKVPEPALVRENLITSPNSPVQQKPLIYPSVDNYPSAVGSCTNLTAETNQSSTKVPDPTDTRERSITGQSSSFDNHCYTYKERTDNSNTNLWIFLSIVIFIVSGLLLMFVVQRSNQK